MNHPEVCLVPVLMFLDYFLTVLGAIQREKKYSEHFKSQHYELNPLWQKAIAKKKWFNIRHTLITVAFSSYLVWFAKYADVPDEFIDGLLGCVIVCFAVLVGRHISNLLIFRYSRRNPDAISGQVRMSHPMMLAVSSYQLSTVLLPVALIAACTGSPFALGGVAGVCLLLVSHGIWRLKFKRQKVKATAAAKSDG